MNLIDSAIILAKASYQAFMLGWRHYPMAMRILPTMIENHPDGTELMAGLWNIAITRDDTLWTILVGDDELTCLFTQMGMAWRHLTSRKAQTEYSIVLIDPQGILSFPKPKRSR